MEVPTLRDLFRNRHALGPFLREMDQIVTMRMGVPTTSNPSSRVERVIISVSDLWLRQTPDDRQSRELLVSRATSEVENLIRLKSITKLSDYGIRFEVQRNAGIVGHHLVGQVWY